ncbi:MAG: hypothetical protein ACI9SC_003021, partial [Gammaproteobacteria bacterium]
MVDKNSMIAWFSSLRRSSCLCVSLVGIAFCSPPIIAESQHEEITSVVLTEKPEVHWLWVNDASFERIEAGRAALVDGDTGKYLGALTTGVFFMTLALPSD